MDFFKTLSRGVYFRFRRVAKALKNWRKFGVVIFGSLFVFANVAALVPVSQVTAAGQLTYLYTDPATLSIEAGKSYQMGYKAYDEDWNPITIAPPTWSMYKPVSGSINASGLFTASATPGTYTNAIKLNSGALSAYAKIIVYASDEEEPVEPKLTYLYTDPATLSIEAGKSYQMGYKAYDEDWNPITIAPPTWSMYKPVSGSINASGLFTASMDTGTYPNAIKLTSGVLSAYAKIIVYASEEPTNEPPVASLVATPDSGTAPLYVTLNASGSYDPDGTIVKYEWDRDGNGSYELTTYSATTPYTYAPGIKTVRVRVTDDYGNTDTASDVVTVSEIPVTNQPPVAHLIATPDSGQESLYVTLNASGSYDPDGYITSYEWDLDGNGTYEFSGGSVTHQWYDTGSHTARVRVTDDDSATATAFDTIYVTDVPTTDYINVQVTPSTQDVYLGNTITYTARVYNKYGSNVTSGSSVSWSLPNSNAGYIESQTNYGSYSQVVVRADDVLGTFPVRAQAWYGLLYDWDEAEMDVIYQPAPTPDYWLTASLYGKIEDGSSPSEGDVILYTLRLTNYRPYTIHNVWVDLKVPSYTAFVSTYSDTDDPYLSGSVVRWNAGNFYNGQAKELYLRVRINEDLPYGGVVIQTSAYVDANEISGFNVYSNKIYVGGSGGPLVPTGIEIEVLAMIALASLALSVMTYAFLNRREILARL